MYAILVDTVKDGRVIETVFAQRDISSEIRASRIAAYLRGLYRASGFTDKIVRVREQVTG